MTILQNSLQSVVTKLLRLRKRIAPKPVLMHPCTLKTKKKTYSASKHMFKYCCALKETKVCLTLNTCQGMCILRETETSNTLKCVKRQRCLQRSDMSLASVMTQKRGINFKIPPQGMIQTIISSQYK